MLELKPLNKSYFNHQFLKFRIQYYFNETKDLLARHKLLTIFIICLLAPGAKNIQVIGTPLYSLIDPTVTLKAKFIYLLSLLFFLLAMTQAQLSFIKGGVFREYLHTLYIPLHVHKAIDFIIILFSLNIFWLAIFFGGASIPHNAEGLLFLTSQYGLYASTVFALCTLLLNFLYKKIISGIVAFFALVLVIFTSKQSNWLLNYGIGINISLLCGLNVWAMQPYRSIGKYPFKIPCVGILNCSGSLGSLKNKFIIQLAVLRHNKITCLIRFILCGALSMFILKILTSPETENNRQELILVLTSLQTYILSTLFTLFEKGKLEHGLFHKIFPYQRQTQIIKEIILIWTGSMLALVPVLLFCIFDLKKYCLLIFLILTTNGGILIMNRFLYIQSLRFCLFSSLLNTMAGCVIQYVLLVG